MPTNNKKSAAKFFSCLPRPKTILAFALGAAAWQLFTSARRLWVQPGLSLRQPTPPIMAGLPQTDMALRIASANVRAGIEERHLPDGRRVQVLCAGWRNFREPWARDFGFASYGLIELDEIRTLKETLGLFFHYQKPDGQFPVKIHSTSVVTRYFYSLLDRQQPITSPLHPKYKTAHHTVSYDGNALLVIAALNYMCHYEDEAFAGRHWEQIKQAFYWLENKAKDDTGLLYQSAYTDWADSVIRKGHIHYTNVLYWRAADRLAEAAKRYGRPEDAAYFSAKTDHLRRMITSYFWQEDLGFFSTSHKFYDILSSDGNLLAIAWGLTTPKQADSILDKMEIFDMADPVPTKPANRSYGRANIAWENWLGGIGHYHTSAAWLWLGSWHVIALTRVGRLDEARTLLERMQAVIIRDGVVHEVYNTDGRPLKTFWYESEAPLTWSASMFVYAWSVYQRRLEIRD
ncbi:MAG TPA: hypothetical protein EYP41_19325 [Anaerolineae bacterium]|nr:hypothetical protein [Anaerolineae bacterium]HIP71688.1 hypothetical protein [Anaerolineae bacterium]